MVILNLTYYLYTMPQGLEISCKAWLFFNIFSGGLYFGALNLELF